MSAQVNERKARELRAPWLLAALLLAASAHAQTPAHPTAQAPATYRIAGNVTNAITGEAVGRATVTLHHPLNGQLLEATESDADGAFALEPMPAGKYALHVARRGFTGSFFNEHGEYSSAIVTGPGQDSEHIPFHLAPGAIVYGTITDDAGEPVRNANIILVRRTRMGGLGEHLAAVINGNTDDNGAYEFWNVQPGTFYLAVKATPWFAVHRFQVGGAAAGQEQSEASKALDVAYPVTYYDGETEEGSATPVTLRDGDRAELNVSLHAVPAMHLLVRMPEQTQGEPRFSPMPTLRQSILGQDEVMNYNESRRGPEGSGMVELAGIAPGHYELSQGFPPKTVELDASGSGTVEVDASQGVPLVKVTIKVRMAGGGPLPKQMQLILRSNDSRQKVLNTGVFADGPENAKAVFGAVEPGSWTLLATGEQMYLAVIALQTAAGQMQDSRIQVKERPLTVSILVAQGAIQVKGFAEKDGKPMAGAMIVLAPADPAANWALFRRDQSDSDGSFQLRDVVPGRYTVFAVEDGWELDWARPDVLQRYLAQGVQVNVSAGAEKEMNLAKPVKVQQK